MESDDDRITLDWLEDELEALSGLAIAPQSQESLTYLRQALTRISSDILRAQHEALHRSQVQSR